MTSVPGGTHDLEEFEALIELMRVDLAADGDLEPETIELIREAVRQHIEKPGLAAELMLEAQRRAGV